MIRRCSIRLATSSSARFGAASPYLFVRKILYVIQHARSGWTVDAIHFGASRRRKAVQGPRPCH